MHSSREQVTKVLTIEMADSSCLFLDNGWSELPQVAGQVLVSSSTMAGSSGLTKGVKNSPTRIRLNKGGEK